MPMPRLLPLLAVAAGGVLAINAIENGPGIVGAARSFAEGVGRASPAQAPLAASAIAPNASLAPPPAPAAAAAPKPAAACAESAEQIAKEAGISPAELQVIQSLGVRRGELDAREQGLSTELALVQAAEAKVDARIAAMNALKGDMQTVLGQLDDKQQAEVDRLVKVYETMINNKPQDAADRFVMLSDDVRLPIAAKMKERLLSAMLAKMSPPEAKRLTESLAARYVAQAAAARQAINPPPAQAAAPPPVPAQTAEAATKVTPKPAAHRRIRRSAPPPVQKLAAAPPEPVWPPKPAPGPPPKSAPGPAPTPIKPASAAPPPGAAKTASAAPAKPSGVTSATPAKPG